MDNTFIQQLFSAGVCRLMIQQKMSNAGRSGELYNTHSSNIVNAKYDFYLQYPWYLMLHPFHTQQLSCVAHGFITVQLSGWTSENLYV